ncbi:MAG: hypothetical protein U0Q47_08335 [Mycobacterium sp.]
MAVQSAELPDFSPERRWMSVLLGALGMLVLAALVAAVITVAHRSSEPAERAPGPVVPSTSSVAPAPAMSSAPSVAPAPATPPAYSTVTATASTVVVAPPAPPVVQPGAPEPKPGVRQRLHDLFPRLFPSP